MSELAQRLDQYEDQIVDVFSNHSFWRDGKDKSLSDEAFRKLLIQRAFYSFEFTRAYDLAEVGIRDEESLQVVRQVRQEEYPLNKPSHRADLVQDLEAIGVRKSAFLSTKPSLATQASIDQLLSLFSWYDGDTHLTYDIRGIINLRLGFELLVAEEYKLFLSEIQRRFGLGAEDSVFYDPHVRHDAKTKPLGAGGGGSHTDRFGQRLLSIVEACSDGELVAQRAMDKVAEAKCSFYDQF